MKQYLLILLFLIFSATNIATAKELKSITICSQNLSNFGFVETVRKRAKKTSTELSSQRKSLVNNFVKGDCDLIATQEVISKNPKEAEEVLKLLGTDLEKRLNQSFQVISGKSNDPLSKLGYIFRSDLFKLKSTKSYSDYLLKKLTKLEKNRYFSRGPLRIDLDIQGQDLGLTLFNFHFKSVASYHSFDSSNYKFEFDRIQMAAGLYEITTDFSRYQPERIIVLLGDRNSDADSASAKVLSGELSISHFQERICHLTKSLKPSCPQELKRYDYFTSIFKDLNPTLTSTKFRLIDDILVPTSFAKHFQNSLNQKFFAKQLVINKDASDHPLLITKLILNP